MKRSDHISSSPGGHLHRADKPEHHHAGHRTNLLTPGSSADPKAGAASSSASAPYYGYGATANPATFRVDHRLVDYLNPPPLSTKKKYGTNKENPDVTKAREYALRTGCSYTEAARKFNVKMKTVSNANTRARKRGKPACPRRKAKNTYTNQQKRDIVDYANRYGVRNAVHEFETSETNIYAWKALARQNRL